MQQIKYISNACCDKARLAVIKGGTVITACPDHPPMIVSRGKDNAK
ncbi:MAG: hypothetical protein H6Q72_946 [Firmicutes bacterium]|nr:hypothetical protein [Bacillota bacterium]